MTGLAFYIWTMVAWWETKRKSELSFIDGSVGDKRRILMVLFDTVH